MVTNAFQRVTSLVFQTLEVQADIIVEVLDGHPLAVQVNLDPFSRGGNVISSPSEKGHSVLIQTFHVKLFQVGLECDSGEVFAAVVLDFVLFGLGHVVFPSLLELLFVLLG